MATSKKLSKKAVKGSKAGQSSCHSWKAWLEVTPTGPWTLRVTGICHFPKHGYKVTFKPAAHQEIDPKKLLLNRIVKAPAGMVIQTPEDVNVNYSQAATAKYTVVTIMPEGLKLKVQIVS
jgi:hypothetical protein